MAPTIAEMTFEPCRVARHWECDPHFSIPTGSGSEFIADCQCECHKTGNDTTNDVTKETQLHFDEPSLGPVVDNTWDVDTISVTDYKELETLADEAHDLFGFHKDFFIAAVWVANQALTKDPETGSFPFWKAYEEAKHQITTGSDGKITLCTGDIVEGLCSVCGGTPGVVFTDTDTDLELHILSDSFYDEDDSAYGEEPF